ncbi:MAG: hypothetical protein EHM39_12505 [Chloroflexi bacterium]|nr:MAG: hypothetical protein EHM39_12505 [Chloroflexota bacterium]
MNRQLRCGLALLVMLLALPIAGVRAQDDPAVEPPPADYGEVAAAYTEMENTTITDANRMIDLMLSGDFAAIYEQFSDEVKALVTVEQLETGYQQVTSAGPLGELISSRAIAVNSQRVYIAQYAWGDNAITLTVAFNAAGEISGLNFVPVTPLLGDPRADYQSAVVFRLPFDGLWNTFWGGPDVLHNYHVAAAPPRHAYDFVVWKDGSTFGGDGTSLEDYYAYGQPALAPADGEVITVVNDLPEVTPQVEMDPAHPAGNHVVIQVAEGEYLFIAHMQPGSIQVEVGDMVDAGQVIGLTGNSGSSSEPHIHIHLQDTPEMFTTDESGTIIGLSDAQGLPLVFTFYLANGEPVAAGVPIGGQFVQNAP